MFAKCDECEDKLPLTTNLSKHNGKGHEHNLILFTQLLMHHPSVRERIHMS